MVMSGYMHKILDVKLSPKGKRRLYMRIAYSFEDKKIYIRNIKLRQNSKFIETDIIMPKKDKALLGKKHGFAKLWDV